MPLKNLYNDEMLVLTRLVLDELRATLDVNGAYRLVLGKFEEILPDLLAVQPPDNAAWAAVFEDGRAADATHDRVLRGLFLVLEALEVLASEADAKRLADARGHLFPGGLRMTQRTYAEEAAEAQRAPLRVTADDQALLAAIRLPDGRSGQDLYEEWLESCRALERVERRRLTLDAAQAEVVLRQIDVRNRWIRIVRNLESVVELAGADGHAVLSAVSRYEAQADERAARVARRAKATAGSGSTGGEAEGGSSSAPAGGATDPIEA